MHQWQWIHLQVTVDLFDLITSDVGLIDQWQWIHLQITVNFLHMVVDIFGLLLNINFFMMQLI